MAKRGYRGKHPHNDMKVSQNAANNKAANNSKLVNEYNKTGVKNKYDYIKSHEGFYPQSTTTLTVNGTQAADKNIVITSTDGTSVTYVAKNSETAGSNQFKRTADNSGSLINCINHASGHGGKILASLSSHKNILLTQLEPGPDGDTIVSGSSPNMTASNQSANQISINGSFSF